MKTNTSPIMLAAALLASTPIVNAQNFDFGSAHPVEDGTIIPGLGTDLTVASDWLQAGGGSLLIFPGPDSYMLSSLSGAEGFWRFAYNYNNAYTAPDRDLTFTFSNPVTFANSGFGIADFGRTDFTITSDVAMTYTGGSTDGYNITLSSDGKTLTFIDIYDGPWDPEIEESLAYTFIGLTAPVSTITLTLHESAITGGSGVDQGQFYFAQHAAVPEPSAALLAGLTGSLALLRRRRKA